MSDTLVAVTAEGILFAANSDRDPNEAQVLEWHPAADHAPGARLTTTWITIDQVAHTHAIVVSKPWWTWGAEVGANEHGVVVACEAVHTRASARGDLGLVRDDLVRLALERACTAADAVEVIVTLLAAHGQVGAASYDHPGAVAHSSFVVADAREAIVVETAGRHWATEDVRARVRAISNALTIPGFADEHGHHARDVVGRTAVRRELAEILAADARGPSDLMAVLRDPGDPGPNPRWSVANGWMAGTHVHAGGLLASRQTVASWVSDLRGRPLHWATGTADPALSLFKPVRVHEPADLGPAPTNRWDADTVWWRHEALHRTALRDWFAAVAEIQADGYELEAEWLAHPPATAIAFAAADIMEREWMRRLDARLGPDTRPAWLRARWRAFDRAAGIEARGPHRAIS